MQAINSQNVDDTFAITSFIVGNPTATINPIGDHYVGDTFSINGSTNLAAGNDLLIEIYSSSFNPTQKIQGSGFSGSSAVVKVEPGTNGINRWSYPVDASAFKPDEYLVKVSGITNDVTVSATFNILAALPPASPSTVTTTPTELRTASPVTQTPSPMPTTTNQSPLSPITILIGLGLVGWATILKRK
jgi:hypothetical protein